VDLDLSSGLILTTQLIDGLIDAGTSEDNPAEDDPVEQDAGEENRKTAKPRGYRYNKRFNCWVPMWKVLVHGNHYSALDSDAAIGKKFKHLFNGQQCRFSR
jgi:hypothetical protein